MDQKSTEYLQKYLDTLPEEEREKYNSFSSDYFCGDEKNANICSDLIRKGIKTATCSMKYWYDAEGEQMPTVGHLQVVTDWSGEPTSIIEVTSVEERKFCDVDAEFAAAEGEGDQSLDWWREAHWNYFSNECKDAGIEPTEEMMLVLERFKVVYK